MTPSGRDGYSTPNIQAFPGTPGAAIEKMQSGQSTPRMAAEDIIAFHVERLIEEGIDEVKRTEPTEKQEAMIRGFEMCRGVRTADDMDRVMREAYLALFSDDGAGYDDAWNAYLQVAFVQGRLAVWFATIEAWSEKRSSHFIEDWRDE